jgi:hypothetical protein
MPSVVPKLLFIGKHKIHIDAKVVLGENHSQVSCFAPLPLVFFYHLSLFINQSGYLTNGVLVDHQILVLIPLLSKFCQKQQPNNSFACALIQSKSLLE